MGCLAKLAATCYAFATVLTTPVEAINAVIASMPLASHGTRWRDCTQPASARASTARTFTIPSASAASISAMVMTPLLLPAAGLTTSARQA